MKKLLLIICILLTGCTTSQMNTYEFYAMNTRITITGDIDESINQKIKDKLSTLEHMYSTTNLSSDIYKINHNEHAVLQEDTRILLTNTLDMAAKTSGAIDPTLYSISLLWGFTTGDYKVPTHKQIKQALKYTGYKHIKVTDTVEKPNHTLIDLGAVGKGYAGDSIIALLKQEGIKSAMINLGGNVQLLGSKNSQDWRIGLQDPDSEDYIGVLNISNQSIITSGQYERNFIKNNKVYGHILNPKTGYPVENSLQSVTIISDKGFYGDALSTALFVMGKEKAITYYEKYKDFDMILVEKNTISITKGIKNAFTNHSNRKIVVIDE